MLMHTDIDKDYNETAVVAKEWATKKLAAVIADGRGQAIQTIQTIQQEQPIDKIVSSAGLLFDGKQGHLTARMPGDVSQKNWHPHAFRQLITRAGVPYPARVGNWLQQPEFVEDFASILNTAYHSSPKKYLVREVDGEVRGFLSDKYKRLDSAPIIESFVSAVTGLGAVPLRGQSLDTKFFLKVILPQIFEPIENEVMCFGVQLKNSDYGDGKLEISGFVHRLRCTNLMMTSDGFSRVHLGRQLSEDIDFSSRTQELDTQAAASAVSDVVRLVLAPDMIKGRLGAIKALSEEHVDADAVIEVLRKGAKLDKTEAQKAKDIFSSAEVELLPPGQNLWRLSNAISLLAQAAEPSRELELEALAGSIAKFND